MFSRYLTERFSLDVSIIRISANTNSSEVEKRLAGIKEFARGMYAEYSGEYFNRKTVLTFLLKSYLLPLFLDYGEPMFL